MDQDLMPSEGLPIPVDSTPVVDLEGAGYWIRALARIIDLVVHNLLMVVVFVIIGIFIGFLEVFQGFSSDVFLERLEDQNVMNYALAILGSVLYHTISEGVHGSTLGKLICGLVVIKEDRKPCGFFPALWRSLAYFIDAFIFTIPAALSMSESSKRQRLGDRWAKTMVVKNQQLMGIMEKRSGVRFVIGFLGALFVDGLLQVISQIIRLIS